jgi:hypothetical protein
MIARIAGAMQLPDWDPKDPQAILERIQRWDGIKHFIRRRLHRYEASGPETISTTSELRAVLVQIIAPLDLGKFLGKMPVAVSSQSALTAAESKPAAETFTKEHVGVILNQMRMETRSTRTPLLREIFADLLQRPTLCADFIAFMNLVVLPVQQRDARYTES